MRVVCLQPGDESIGPTEYPGPKGRSIRAGARSNGRSFQHIAIIVNDIDNAYSWSRPNKIEHASSGPQRLPDWHKSASGIQPFYYKHPDGHPLEILQFPPDEGAQKWHWPSDKLFLGIDHTAMVVNGTHESRRLYRDLPGMRIVGDSENGVEKKHLNDIFGAHLGIA